MDTLTLIEVGDLLGVVFPDEWLARHGWREGDILQFEESAHGWKITLPRGGEAPLPDHDAQTR